MFLGFFIAGTTSTIIGLTFRADDRGPNASDRRILFLRNQLGGAGKPKGPEELQRLEGLVNPLNPNKMLI